MFVAVYQKTLSLLYVDELLQRVKDAFVPEYKPSIYSYKQFDETFTRLLKECEAKAEEAKRPTQMRAAAPVKVGRTLAHGSRSSACHHLVICAPHEWVNGCILKIQSARHFACTTYLWQLRSIHQRTPLANC